MGMWRSTGLARIGIAVFRNARFDIRVKPDLGTNRGGFGAVTRREEERRRQQRAATSPQVFPGGIVSGHQTDIGMAFAIERSIGNLHTHSALVLFLIPSGALVPVFPAFRGDFAQAER